VDVIEAAMQKAPKYWRDHYRGTPERQALARKYSFSDRVRYYWNDPNVESSLNRLLINLGRKVIPYSLLSQFTPIQYERIRQGLLQNSPETLIVDRINSVLQNYIDACEG
jgi:D-tagatose-1,6-bisphosphate aldolase subunit GatZ/KbaZ